MKASLINIRLTSRYSAGIKLLLSLSKDFVHYFQRSRSGQVHSFMAALTCLCSEETHLTLTCPSPKSFVCNLPDSERHVTSVFQGLSLSLRKAGRREPWEQGWHIIHFLGGEYCWIVQDSKPISLLKSPRSLSVHTKIGYSIFFRQLPPPPLPKNKQ